MGDEIVLITLVDVEVKKIEIIMCSLMEAKSMSRTLHSMQQIIYISRYYHIKYHIVNNVMQVLSYWTMVCSNVELSH